MAPDQPDYRKSPLPLLAAAAGSWISYTKNWVYVAIAASGAGVDKGLPFFGQVRRWDL